MLALAERAGWCSTSIYDPWPTPLAAAAATHRAGARLGSRPAGAPGGAAGRADDRRARRRRWRRCARPARRRWPRGAGPPIAPERRGRQGRYVTWYLDTAARGRRGRPGDRGAGAPADRPAPRARARARSREPATCAAAARTRPTSRARRRPKEPYAEVARAARAAVEVALASARRRRARSGGRVGWHPVAAVPGRTSCRCASRWPSWTGAPGYLPTRLIAPSYVVVGGARGAGLAADR